MTNTEKFTIITIGFYKAANIVIDNTPIPYSNDAKLLGLTFKRNNFYVKQVDSNVNRARAELKKLARFRYLKTKLKVRLYKTLILPLLTYPVVPLNICSKTQIKRLQVIQNDAIRWIKNERWPAACPLDLRHQELKIEPLDLRIRRLAEGVWNKIHEENSFFHNQTLAINMHNPHKWYPSSYYLETFN